MFKQMMWLLAKVIIMTLMGCGKNNLDKAIEQLEIDIQSAQTHEEWQAIYEDPVFYFHAPQEFKDLYKGQILRGLYLTSDNADQMQQIIQYSYRVESWDEIAAIVQWFADNYTDVYGLYEVLDEFHYDSDFPAYREHATTIANAMFNNADSHSDWNLVAHYAYGLLNDEQKVAASDSLQINCSDFRDWEIYSEWRDADHEDRQLAYDKMFELAGDDHNLWNRLSRRGHWVPEERNYVIYDALVRTVDPDKVTPGYIADLYDNKYVTDEHRRYLLSIYRPTLGSDGSFHLLVNALSNRKQQDVIWHKTYQALVVGDLGHLIQIYQSGGTHMYSAPSAQVKAKLITTIIERSQTVDDWALVAELATENSSLHTLALQQLTCHIQN